MEKILNVNKEILKHFKERKEAIPENWRDSFCMALGNCSECKQKKVVYYELGDDTPYCIECHNFKPTFSTIEWGAVYGHFNELLYYYEKLLNELSEKIFMIEVKDDSEEVGDD